MCIFFFPIPALTNFLFQQGKIRLKQTNRSIVENALESIFCPGNLEIGPAPVKNVEKEKKYDAAKGNKSNNSTPNKLFILIINRRSHGRPACVLDARVVASSDPLIRYLSTPS